MPVETIEEALPLATPTSASVKAAPRNEKQIPTLGRAAQSGTLSTVTVIFMVLFHIAAVAALFMFSWKALICTAVLWVYASNVGIGMCYHRLLTHRGYKTPKWIEYLMAIGSPIMKAILIHRPKAPGGHI
jgi:fatty-acid desaturase